MSDQGVSYEEHQQGLHERAYLVLDAMQEGIWDWNVETNEVYLSPLWKQMLGYQDEELPCSLEEWRKLIHPDDIEMAWARARACLDGSTSNFSLQYRLLHKDGRYRWIEARGATLRDTTGRVRRFAGTHADITDRTELYRQLRDRADEREHEVRSLLKVIGEFGTTLELDPLLDLILDRIETIVDYSVAAIFLLRNEHDLSLLRYRGPAAPERVPKELNLDDALHNHEVIVTKRPVLIPDTSADTPLAAAFRKQIKELTSSVPTYVSSWMGVPLMLRGEVIGMMTLAHSERDHYTARHTELALAVATQAAIAVENARLYERSLSTAALEERQRLARELHDSVSQALYGIALGARTARTLLDRDPILARQPMDYVLALADAGLAEMRALIFELRPESLEMEGIVAAFQKQAASLAARHNIEVNLDLPNEPDIPLSVKEVLYRIGQEGLNNIIKHANATAVRIHLRYDVEAVELTIVDNGIGFDTSQSFPGHLGLRSMQERAAYLHGQLSMTSSPGQGTTLCVHIPNSTI